MSDLYEQDFYAWANEQAALLRAGKLAAADIENIAEEIESIGRSEKRELVNRLTVLLLHMLKCRFQPDRRGRSRELSIRNARTALTRHIADNPSLKSKLTEAMAEAYESGRVEAAIETDIPLETFPESSPWTFDEVMQVEP
jgi:hypothetical protein